MSPSLAKQIGATCDWTGKPDSACSALIEQMQAEVGHVNLYNVYGTNVPRSCHAAALVLPSLAVGRTRVPDRFGLTWLGLAQGSASTGFHEDLL